MDNIIDIKNAVETLKPILNQAQINQLNTMIENAVTAYHEGLVDTRINSDLDALGIVKTEFIFEDTPF
jgi:hypothetical protein